MERDDFGCAAAARLCAKVCMSVSPEAALGLCRAYPCGRPTICPPEADTQERGDALRFVIRQPFVAEIPVAIRSGIRASRPLLRGGRCASKEAKPWL